MIPGQLRPTFASHDREKRLAFTMAAGLLALVAFVSISRQQVVLPIVALLVALVIASQVIYAARIRGVRNVRDQLQQRFPSDRFLVGNVRFVGAHDRGPDAVAFTTTILQFTQETLSLWNPDKPTNAFAAIPLDGLDVGVMKTTPPRWGLVAPFSNDATYLALFAECGLAFERPEDLRKLANALFPGVSIPEPPERPGGKIGF